MTVKQFILLNWKNTYRTQATRGLPLPKPFTVPSISDAFRDFFYWDTYFTNIGLLLSNEKEQARNNLENIAHIIQLNCFMTNANHILDRSQPPLFARALECYFQSTQDESILLHCLPALEKEINFWEKHRSFKDGFFYYAHQDVGQAVKFFHAVNKRVNLKVEISQEEYEGRNLLAMAESGWDFTHRFQTKNSPVDICCFAPIDLNCILCEAQSICGNLLIHIGEIEKGETYLQSSNQLKTLIESFMRDANGIYVDYNEELNEPSQIISAASFFPFACGLSTDNDAFKKTLSKLELTYGISATEYIENGYQWDYPNVWPPLMYFAVVAAEKLGEIEIAKRIAKKYLTTLDNIFLNTNKIWEKYDGRTGNLPEHSEYGTPDMMGWTAGVYLYFAQKYES